MLQNSNANQIFINWSRKFDLCYYVVWYWFWNNFWESFRITPPLFHSIWNNIVSNLPQWDIPLYKNEWWSGVAGYWNLSILFCITEQRIDVVMIVLSVFYSFFFLDNSNLCTTYSVTNLLQMLLLSMHESFHIKLYYKKRKKKGQFIFPNKCHPSSQPSKPSPNKKL